MALYRSAYRIESTRLREWDYGAPGWYFVTICTKDQRCDFGTVQDGVIVRSEIGEVAFTCWEDIPAHFPHVVLDAFVVMPNHVHGLIGIPVAESEIGIGRSMTAPCGVETRDLASLPGKVPVDRQGNAANRFGPLVPGSLPAIIHGYKSSVTRTVRRLGHHSFAWQSRYHERIIRGERGLEAVRAYVRRNPARWVEDRYYSGD